MKHCTRRSPSGTVLICVLACLIVVTALIGSATQAALRGRSAARIQKQLRQTELLCEAGVLRAAQQLKKSADYEGEQWRPNLFAARPDDPSQRGSDDRSPAEAIVDIRVTERDDSSRNVEVVAKLDSHTSSAGPLQRSHRFRFEISPASSSEKR